MAYLLWVRGAAGNVAIPDLGVTIAQGPSWTLLSNTSPPDAEGNAGQFSARELRDSSDLYDLITGGSLEWSKNGSTVTAADQYVADFMLMQDFSDDFLDLTSGILTIPNDVDSPASGQEGNIFWDSDNHGLWMHDGNDWVLVATATGVQNEHGLLDGLDDDDHDIYALLSGDLIRNVFTGGVDFNAASGLILPTGTNRTGLSSTEGNVMWDTDDDELWLYDGTQWVNVGAAIASGVLEHDQLGGLADDDHLQYLTEARHDALPSDNPHNVTFTQAVTADSGTNITAAEAETLTDGSNADSLHVHNYSSPGHNHDHGTLTGLGDDDHPQYPNVNEDETISGVWTFDTDVNEPAFVITPDTDAPTTKLVDGAIAIIDDLLSVYDSTRGKWLSVDRSTFSAARRGNATNIYMRISGDDVPSNVSSYAMARNGTIVAMTAATQTAKTWTFEIHVNGSSVVTLSCTGTSTVAIDKNIDFSAGDVLEFYCNGAQVPWPVGTVEVAWRE